MSNYYATHIFLGHGSPMNAIQDTEFSRGWASLGEKITSSKSGNPAAVVIVSAHWLTEGTYITKASKPQKQSMILEDFPKSCMM
jgi:4,5-DOPA dioxygenase extradiol